ECDLIAMHLPCVFDVEYCRTMGKNIMDATRAGGIEKVVFHTSCYVADRDLDLSAHDGRRAIEKAIEDSGIPYAVIRSAVFMDNMQRAWLKPSIVKNGIFAYPAAEDLLISWVSLEDIAAYMIAALEAEDVTADKFMVGGPEALVGSQVAEILSDVLGRTVEFKSLSPDQFAQEMAYLVTGSRDVEPHSIYDGMAKFYAFYNDQPTSPLNVDLEPVLKRLKIKPTSLEEWARAQDWTV
ncbi:MAG: NmrA family NAD(P)-binding protein, partial [Alphaproteobacteria bacterium]|nr:NmrA family NAD(P)-binding protein [Alphaproteobacteria bacterium]